MLKDYLNQTAILEVQGDPDQYADRTTSSSIAIACRKQGIMRVAMSADGPQFIARTMYIFERMQTAPRANVDKLDGKVITEIIDYVDLAGEVLGYEAYV